MARRRCLLSSGTDGKVRGRTGKFSLAVSEDDRPGRLTTEGRNGAEHAAVQYAFGLAGVVAPNTGNFGRIATVVQYV